MEAEVDAEELDDRLPRARLELFETRAVAPGLNLEKKGARPAETRLNDCPPAASTSPSASRRLVVLTDVAVNTSKWK